MASLGQNELGSVNLLWNCSQVKVTKQFGEESTLVQVMAWYRQATNHYLSQCWVVGRDLYRHMTTMSQQSIHFWPVSVYTNLASPYTVSKHTYDVHVSVGSVLIKICYLLLDFLLLLQVPIELCGEWSVDTFSLFCESEYVIWRHVTFRYIELTYWGQHEMDNVSQTTLWNVFSSMKMFEFQLKLKFVPKGPINNIPVSV